MLGSAVTSQYPGNDLQREAEKKSAFCCPENPFLETDSYLAFLLHVQSLYWGGSESSQRARALPLRRFLVEKRDASGPFPRGEGGTERPTDTQHLAVNGSINNGEPVRLLAWTVSASEQSFFPKSVGLRLKRQSRRAVKGTRQLDWPALCSEYLLKTYVAGHGWKTALGVMGEQLPVKSQVKGVLREDQVFRHQIVAVRKLRLLLAQGGYQARFFLQTWNEKHLCVKSDPAALVRGGLKGAPAEDRERPLAMLGSVLLAFSSPRAPL